ncbi:MAG TPA: hypothetical protein VJC04_01550 [Candidatus Paceibacterota bacterium]
MKFEQVPTQENVLDKEQALKEFREIFSSEDLNALSFLDSAASAAGRPGTEESLEKNGVLNTRILLEKTREFEKKFRIDLGLSDDLLQLQRSFESRASHGEAGNRARELAAKIRNMEGGNFLNS